MLDITERPWAQELVNGMIVLSPLVPFNQLDKKSFLSIHSVAVVGWIESLPKRYIRTLTPKYRNVTVFGDRAFMEENSQS